MDFDAIALPLCGGHKMRYGVIAMLMCAGLVAMAIASSHEERDDFPVGKTSQAPFLEYCSSFKPGARMYRVRNTGDNLKTEIKWQDNKEVLARGRIAKCPKGCEWAEFSTTDDKAVKKTTSFGFGVNGDQFEDKPKAFCRDNSEEKEKEKETKSGMPLRTTIRGVFANKDDQDVKIDLTVTSSIVSEDLVYVFEVRGVTHLTLSASSEKKEVGSIKYPLLVWESVDSPSFKEAVGFKNVELERETRYT
jgi:hypothetical protein